MPMSSSSGSIVAMASASAAPTTESLAEDDEAAAERKTQEPPSDLPLAAPVLATKGETDTGNDKNFKVNNTLKHLHSMILIK